MSESTEKQEFDNRQPSHGLRSVIESAKSLRDINILRNFALISKNPEDLTYLAIHNREYKTVAYALNNNCMPIDVIVWVLRRKSLASYEARIVLEKLDNIHKAKVDVFIKGLTKAERDAMSIDDNLSLDNLLGLFRYGDPDNITAINNRRDIQFRDFLK